MITKDELEKLKQKYQKGMRIRLITMDDIQAPPIGTEGTIKGIDDFGAIRVSWDTGSCLSIIPDEDNFEILT